MNESLQKAIALAASSSPMGSASVPITPNRILLPDGDGLAYYCAGNDDTAPGEARANLLNKVTSARRISGCAEVEILATPSGSIKGHRYAIATVKPYQGQRKGDRRPKNWQYLRDLLESGSVGGMPVTMAQDAEADDLFAERSVDPTIEPVFYTQDKDMRMLTGYHLDWVSHRIHLHEGFSSTFNDKLYGQAWFWHQMLHGDAADNIPGLPYINEEVYPGKTKQVRIGEVRAGRLLISDRPSFAIVSEAYANCYGDKWLTAMMEQACLLWLQRSPGRWDDCCALGGPLHEFIARPEFAEAYATINDRVENARSINKAAAEGGADSDHSSAAIV